MDVVLSEKINGGDEMGYETKVILVALAELTKKSKSVEEVYEHIAKAANVEGLIIEPFSAESKKDKKEKENKEEKTKSKS